MVANLILPGKPTTRGRAAVRGGEFPWLNRATERKLVGARTRDEWIDAVAEATPYTGADREALTQGVFRTNLRAYEDRITTELRRTGALKPGQRWSMRPNDATRRALWADAEKQVGRIADTYDRDRAKWARDLKASDRRMNRHHVRADFDRWNETRAAWKGKQVEDTELMRGDMRAGEEFYTKTGLADPKKDKGWYWYTIRSGASQGITRRTVARAKGLARKGKGKGKKLGSPPCERCVRMQRGNPYTLKKLIERARSLGAMDARHFVMHPWERCSVMFKPKGGVRSKANAERTRAWALRHGSVSR